MNKLLYIALLLSSIIFAQENDLQLKETYYVGKMFTNNIIVKFNAEIIIENSKITITSKDATQEIHVKKEVNSAGNVQYIGNGNRFIISNIGGTKKFPYSIIHDIKDDFTGNVTQIMYQCYEKKQNN